MHLQQSFASRIAVRLLGMAHCIPRKPRFSSERALSANRVSKLECARSGGRRSSLSRRHPCASPGIVSGQLEAEPVVCHLDDLFAKLSSYDVDFSDVRGRSWPSARWLSPRPANVQRYSQFNPDRTAQIAAKASTPLAPLFRIQRGTAKRRQRKRVPSGTARIAFAAQPQIKPLYGPRFSAIGVFIARHNSPS
jgi:hypothetical protein